MKPGVIYIRNRAIIYNPDPDVVNYIKKTYTYDNPKYDPFKNPDVPEQVKSWSEKFKTIEFDVGILTFDTYLQKLPQIDERVMVPFKMNVTLPEDRDYQTRAIEVMTRYAQGVLKAPCGSGKSLMMLKIMANLGQRSILIVDEIKLILQWQQNARKFAGMGRVGIIGNGEFTLLPFTVATIQTLYKLNKVQWHRIEKYFGCLCVDECQKTPSPTCQVVVSKFWCKYKLGCSATPKRMDGMQFLLHNCISTVKHEIKDTELKVEGKYVDFEVRKTYTGLYVPDNNYNEMVKFITQNNNRNELIVSKVIANKDKLSLILTNRILHAKTLLLMLKRKGINAVLMIGEIDAQTRERTRHNKNIQAIIGSSVADKGLDLPRIHAIFLTVISSNPYLLEQRVGRSRRVYEDKLRAIVYDFVDKGDAVQHMWDKREEFYIEHHAKIVEERGGSTNVL